MRGSGADVTDTELAVLKILWDCGPSTIRRITDRLYPGGRTSHYSTVQKLLERLESKECVQRRLEGRSNVFTAAVERDQLIARRLRETADKLCEGSLTPLLTHLVGEPGLSKDEIDALRRLVERADARDGARGPE
jgi:predicted transcriptional regulator